MLDSPDKTSIVAHVVNHEVNQILYERPHEWFAYLDAKAKLGRPSAAEIEKIAEVKASRDVLVHNRGMVNKTYESKAGNLARYTAGQRMDIPEPYHRETWELLRRIVTDLADAALAKAT